MSNAAEAPNDRDARMKWWREARFGMFIHWGLYAIPAGEWEGRTDHAEWIMETAKIPASTYEKFVHQFNPTKFDAQ
jgi:alpha-L-fucosidase